MPAIPPGPALGLIELCSVARGLRVADALLKRAPVHLRENAAVMPGKHLIRIEGGVDEVDEALGAARQAAADTLLDSLLLPHPHPQLSALLAAPRTAPLLALGIIECYTITAAVRALDAALKAAEVEGLRLDRGLALGGKASLLITGALCDIEAALEAGLEAAGVGYLVGHEIIANPHPQLSL